MTFLECVNRILRLNAIIRGDTDTVSTFSDTQHNATLNVGILAVQDELTSLIADKLIPYERKTTGSITFVTEQRTYSLAADFTRFYGYPHFYRSADNRQIYEYPGGLEGLQIKYYDYATQYGDPIYFYWEPTTTKKVGFFQVPSSAENGDVWTYEYEGSVMVTASSDTMPFHNDEESNTFTLMAGRRFKFLLEDVKNEIDIVAVLEKDRTYQTAKATLIKLIKGQNPCRRYGAIYR